MLKNVKISKKEILRRKLIGKAFKKLWRNSEFRTKMLLARTGIKRNDEARKHMSENHPSKKENYVPPMLGKHHSLRTKEKISRSNKCYYAKLTEKERKLKMSFCNSALQRKLGKKGALAAIESFRKNKSYWFLDVPFASKQECICAKKLFSSFWFYPEENINCHVKIGNSEFDFKIFDFLFIEYHPWDFDGKTHEQYYKERRKILDANGFNENPLVVINEINQSNFLEKLTHIY